MAVAPCGHEYFLAPVHICFTVIISVKGTLCEVFLCKAEVNIVFRAHDIKLAGEGGVRELVVVENLSLTL